MIPLVIGTVGFYVFLDNLWRLVREDAMRGHHIHLAGPVLLQHLQQYRVSYIRFLFSCQPKQVEPHGRKSSKTNYSRYAKCSEPERLEHDRFIYIKEMAHFKSESWVLVDFSTHDTQISCLTGQ